MAGQAAAAETEAVGDQQQSFKMQQAAEVEAKTAVVLALMASMRAVEAAAVAAVVEAVKFQEQIVAAMVIA
jgi:hypothetical protein